MAGAAAGAASTLVILNPAIFPANVGWRLASRSFRLLDSRSCAAPFIPESPRWLLVHGRSQEAEATVGAIEALVAAKTGEPLPAVPLRLALRIRPRQQFGLYVALRALVAQYRSRAILGLALMAAQGFVYNAIFFTYALVLSRYYSVLPQSTGFYLFPFAI